MIDPQANRHQSPRSLSLRPAVLGQPGCEYGGCSDLSVIRTDVNFSTVCVTYLPAKDVVAESNVFRSEDAFEAVVVWHP